MPRSALAMFFSLGLVVGSIYGSLATRFLVGQGW